MVCSVAYSTCAKSEADRRASQLVATAEEQELAVVKDAEIDDGQLIHYPGFDVYFSNNHRQPYYVSWVLTPEHARGGSVKRSDKFRPDPDVENCAQLDDYRNSGFDRGHMAPSADFKYAEDAQLATFFLTNMSPQRHELNGGAWGKLEDQCRNWAQRDSTLIIIAGPVLSDRIERTIGANEVSVPGRYFKVVLAPYAVPPRAIGFIMPNRYVEGGVQATAVSVDDVEEITGYDFFSALPDEIEDRLEAEGRYSQWQYSKSKKKKK